LRALEELEYCVVKAERSGMVLHPSAARWKNAPEIEEGATVHKDQILLLMPDLSQMQVKIGIHESIVDRIVPGLPARVTLPERTLDGEVASVASVTSPAGWWTGNVVKYDTVIKLPSGEDLKPGMSAEVEVIMDRNPVQVNESFQLVFSLDQSPDDDPDFSILQQHFMILGNSRSNSISIVNGEYQRSVKWTLQLMAKQIGEYMIPEIRFDKERSKPFQIKVLPSSQASVPQDQLVLELLVDKPKVYVQSQVIVTLRLLSASSISAYNFGDISTDDLDVVIEPLGDERDYRTRIADKSYLVLEKQFALFPQQSGRLRIAPVMAEVRLPSGSTFDPFRTGGKIRRLRSRQVFIDVEPIPPGLAGSYWLPATRLELREEWQSDLDGLVAGEPITRSLTLVADGLTAAQLPELAMQQIDGIKQYPDQPGLQNGRSSKGITGKREQKVALIPGAEGIYRVPEFSLPWWNLETGKLETATIPARELSVASATTAVAQPSVTEQPVTEAVEQVSPA
ncbi:MAG: hypothetical protein GY783_21795, partial [Gammaproteobacteria bacterium]|nr:hypothetical protein [Gammaproteobacteria bacterium]